MKTIHKTLTYLIALIWLANGLFCKVLNLVPRHQDHAYAWSRTRITKYSRIQMKTSRNKKRTVLATIITFERLRKRGYVSLLEVYILLNPSVYEPPYMQLKIND